jgi:hypothetical protein
VSDIEHQLVLDVRALLARTRHVAELAQRAILAAQDAQDAAGGHEPWLDDALAEVETELSRRYLM